MDDYIIDEKLLRDIQEATYIPTPYPPRSEQGIFTSTNPPKPILNNTNLNEKDSFVFCLGIVRDTSCRTDSW